jgi:hypothetical protein
MKKIPKVLWISMVSLGGLAGCAGADSESSGGGKDYGYKSDGGTYYSNGSGGSFGLGIPAVSGGGTSGGGTATTPPEQETKVDFTTPQGGKQRVYVANPTRNTITIINANGPANAPTIREQSSGGQTPSYVSTIPGQDIALVINTGSHTLAVLRDDEAPKSTYPIVSKANAVAVAPDGKHAVVWFDSSQATTSSVTSTGSTQEVSVVTLGATGSDAVFSMTVGYNPSAVVFSSDGSAAFVVTDDGISELRFAEITGPRIAPFTRVDDGSQIVIISDAGAPTTTPDAASLGPEAATSPDLAPPSTDGETILDGGVAVDGGGRPDVGRDTTPASPDAFVAKDTAAPLKTTGKPVDVSVTRAGDYAVARRDGSAALLLVDLKARKVSTLVLSSEITDLDLVDGKAGPQAYAVLRSESTLVRIDIPAGFTDPAHRKTYDPFSGAIIGSVTISANGTYALLYTTAVPSTTLAIFDLTTETLLTSPAIKKNIRAVAVSPNEKTALVLHDKGQSSSDQYGYSLVDLASSSTVLMNTSADPKQFIITPDSTNAFVVLRDDKASIRTVQRVSLTSFLERNFDLGSPPSSIAALSSDIKKVFVGQVYTEGRISFINWETDVVQTVTGFALSGRIQQ